jgi:hypothetical protein
MHISSVTFVVLLVCGYVLSADNQTQSEWNEVAIIPDGSFVKKEPMGAFPHIKDELVVIPVGSFVKKEPIFVFPRIHRRSIKCYQGPMCHNFINCLRSSRVNLCK